MFYASFISASEEHINWLRWKIQNLLGISGHITKSKKQVCYQLKYAKTESLILLKQIYYTKEDLFLERKYLKINNALAIMGESV